MAYNPYRWWTKGRKRKLSVKEHLYDRIKNGDFDYSQFYSEAAAAREEQLAIFNEHMSRMTAGSDYFEWEAEARIKSKMKHIKAMKLDEEALKDDIKILDSLKKELHKHFGFCLWDKMMNRRAMDAEQLFDFYCNEQMKRKGLFINK